MGFFKDSEREKTEGWRMREEEQSTVGGGPFKSLAPAFFASCR